MGGGSSRELEGVSDWEKDNGVLGVYGVYILELMMAWHAI